MLQVRTLKKIEDNYDLDSIVEPIRDDFNRFKENYKLFLQTDIGLLNKILKYIKNQDGKRIRPILLLLSGGLCGKINDNHIKSAVIIEILHTASLIHDDIVDNANERRGVPTINHLWNNQLSVLVGDFLLSVVLKNVNEMNDYEILKILSNITNRMAKGEILQIESNSRFLVNEEKYLRIIADKTAGLFSACCEISAVISKVNLKKRNAMKRFGEYLGIAFQIKDDLFEFSGKRKKIGKPKGVDIKNNSITLPLIYSLNMCSRKERKKIIEILQNGVEKKDIKEIISFTEKSGGVAYANGKARQYAELAKSNLKIFTDSSYKESLLKFVDFAINREK